MTEEPKICADCGSPIPPDAVRGLCPRCVLGLAGPAGSQRPSTEASSEVATHDRTSCGDGPVGSASPDPASPAFISFGEYEILEEIARGGMGVVYKARQKALNRIVAVKTILAGHLAGKQIAQRFKGEAGAAAVLQHANIVAVHEVGVHEGVHFFSMDYVEGKNLAQLVGSRPLPASQAARYTQIIANAIHYAHQQGILHRDLKPSNILIDSATDQPRVTDFGLARRLDTESSLTVTGQVLGSPNFMPPEQAGGRKGSVGRASDVYGLGGILYYLLTARAPFQGETLEGVVTQVIHADPIPPRLLNPNVPRDLNTICLKCLAKEPHRRYATAKEVADELTRFLSHEPIQARPVGLGEKTWRWCQRRPALAVLSGTVLMLLLTMGIGAPIAAFRIDRARLQLERQLYAADINRAHAELEDGYPLRARQRLARYLPPAGGKEDLRGFEWRLLWQWTQPTEHSIQWKASRTLGAMTLSPDGTRLALVEGGDTVHVLEWPSGRHLKTFTGFPAHIGLLGISFSPGGNRLAAKGGLLRVWRTDTWAEVANEIEGADPLVSPCDAVVFSPDSATIAMRAPGGGAGIWSVDSSSRLTLLPPPNPATARHFAQLMSYSRDGTLLAISAYDSIQIRRAGSLELVTNLPPATVTPVFFHDTVQALAWSSNLLAAGYRDGTLGIWDASTWRPQAAFKAHPRGWLHALDFSQDGSLLASGGGDDVICLWRVPLLLPTGGSPATRRPSASLIGHTSGLVALRFLPAGDRLLSSSTDGTLRLWSNWSLDVHSTLPGAVVPSGYQSNGTALVCLHSDGTHGLWDPRLRRPLGRLPVPLYPTEVHRSILSPDGDTLALCASNQITLWSLARQARRASFPVETAPEDLCFSPSGNWLAAGVGGFRRYLAHAWDVRSGLETFRSKELVTSMAFSPDGRWLATSPAAGGVTLLDIATRRCRPVPGLRETYQYLGFSPHSGILVALGGHGGTSRGIWLADLRSGRISGPLTVPGTLAHSTFTPDGRTLISLDGDNGITFWNVATLQELMTIARPATLNFLMMSPDGNVLALKAPADRHTLGGVETWAPPGLESIDSSLSGLSNPHE